VIDSYSTHTLKLALSYCNHKHGYNQYSCFYLRDNGGQKHPKAFGFTIHDSKG
jgi:hypothetical protein